MNGIDGKVKLSNGQILKVDPERDFTNNPRGRYYSNPNNSVGIEYSVDNTFSVGAQFIYNIGEENMIIIGGKALDAMRRWDKVQNFVNLGGKELLKDGKLTPGDTYENSYKAPKFINYLKSSIQGKENFWTPIHPIGSFGFSMRVNSDGESVTVAVYNSNTISSLTDNILGKSANVKNNLDRGRTAFSTQYIRFIWKIYLK